MSKIRERIENGRELYSSNVAVDEDVHISVASSTNTNPDSVSLSNIVSTTGFSTYLHTGNGSTQDIENGIDFITASASVMALPLWTVGTYNTGDEVTIVRESRAIRVVCLQDGVTSDPNTLYDFTDATFSDWQIDSQTNGGLIPIKNRDVAYGHKWYDTLRGIGIAIDSSTTGSDAAFDATSVTSFNTDGFSVGALVDINGNTNKIVSWSYQTTHIKSSLTSHGKPQIEEYNPITGFTMIKYKGSGLAGHEISHSMGRELAIRYHKSLDTVNNWNVHREGGKRSVLNQTIAELDDTFTDDGNGFKFTLNTSDTGWNGSNNLYITHGWANAIETDEGLQGNFEIGTYTGTGVAGNKITTKGKPAYVMIKRIDNTESWVILDLLRNNFDGELIADTSASEVTGVRITPQEDGFVFDSGVRNASGGQYLYFVIYDNDNGSGKSKYDKPTDTTNLTLTNSYFNHTAGITDKGYTLTSRDVTKTVDTSLVSDGIKWVSENSDGSNSFYDVKPNYGSYVKTSADDNRPRFIDGRWYNTVGGELVINGTFDTDVNGWTLGASVAWSNQGLTFTASNNTDTYSSAMSLVVGTKYMLSIKCSESSGSFPIRLAESGNLTNYVSLDIITSDADIEFIYDGTFDTIDIRSNSVTGRIDNISVYAVEPTIGTEIIPTPSFMQNPVYVDNGVPQYIDYSQELEVNYMDSLYVDRLRVGGNRKILEIGTIYNNTKYLIPLTEVFADYDGNYENYDVRIQMLVDGIWSEHSITVNTTSNATGTSAIVSSKGIMIQTAYAYVYVAGAQYGGVGGLNTLTSALARVIVTYIGDTKDA